MIKSLKALSKTKVALLIIAAILAVIGIGLGIKAYLDRPQDLGAELQYIGKEYSSGCFFLLFCDSPASTTYYFATDISAEELKGYFKKGKYLDRSGGGTSANYSFATLSFNYLGTNNIFHIDYYDRPDTVRQMHELKSSNKKNIVSLNEGDYKEAQQALD